MKRKLTTIFCADVSGYSRLMGADEARTLATLKEYREAIEGFIGRHHGRVVSWSGDGLLAEFASVVEAVQCAAEVQRELKARNSSLDEDRRMTFRIGINLGDVMVDGDDIFGEGVNIAARLQQMAPPGGILISSPVYDQVRGKLSLSYASLGAQTVKNIAGEVSVYAVTISGVTPQAAVNPARPSWGEDQSAASEPTPAMSRREQRRKRGKLFRRGLALLVDYAIVAFVCLVGALTLNSTVSPTVVRMDLDLPFVDYGDIVNRTPWVTRERSVEENVQGLKQERFVTYDYFGMFQQTYRQTCWKGNVALRDDEKTDRTPSGGHPGAKPQPAQPPAPAQPVPPVPPVPPVGGASPSPAPVPSPVPAPSPAPAPDPVSPPDPVAPPTPPGAPVHIDDNGVTVGDVRIDETGVHDAGQPASGPVSSCAENDDDKATIRIRSDKNGIFHIFGSYTSEQLVDLKSGREITRPSLDTLSLILLVLYFTLMEAGLRGSSIGKNAFNLTVTREDGRHVGYATALGRNVIKVLSFIILPIAILVALVSRRRQGIHDRIAGTVVVKAE